MTRQTIDVGGWLDLDTAKKFKEATCRAHGTQQTLYRTTRGTYVVHQTSQHEGSRNTWTRLDTAKAIEWLLRNDYEPDSPDELAIVAALEV